MLITVRKLESLDTFSIFVIFQEALFCSREKEKGKRKRRRRYRERQSKKLIGNKVMFNTPCGGGGKWRENSVILLSPGVNQTTRKTCYAGVLASGENLLRICIFTGRARTYPFPPARKHLPSVVFIIPTRCESLRIRNFALSRRISSLPPSSFLPSLKLSLSCKWK